MTSQLSELLGKCPKDSVSKFLHGIADALANRPSLEYSAYSETWTLEEWFEVTDQTSTLLKACVCDSQDQESVDKSLDVLDTNVKDCVTTVLGIREEEIRKALKEKSVAISNSHLKDFDWKVKLVLASDKLANIQEPLTTVDLDIQSGDKVKSVNVELDKAKLKSLITSLEAANQAVTRLTSD